MHVTYHFDSRMNQRGIRRRLVDLTLDLGEPEGDRVVLSVKTIDQEILDLQRRMRDLTEARKKGGVVVVSEDDALITTYRGVGTGHAKTGLARVPQAPYLAAQTPGVGRARFGHEGALAA